MANRPKLGQLLLEVGVIDEAQLRAALGEQQRWGRPLGATLVQLGFVDEETLVRTLARQLAVPVVWLRGRSVRRDILELVPREIAVKHRCLPVLLDERGRKTLLVAMEDPSDLSGADEIAFTSGLPVKPVLAAPSELREAIGRHYPAVFGEVAPDLGSAESGSEPPDLLRMPDVSPPAALEARRPSASESDTILRALTQLLVEKGVVTREELIERVRKLEGST